MSAMESNFEIESVANFIRSRNFRRVALQRIQKLPMSIRNRLAAQHIMKVRSGRAAAMSCKIGGLNWTIPEGFKIEDYTLFWIGSDNTAFANVVLTFNGCEIVRYDATENRLITDLSQLRRILKRRYYLVEKAKDANIVGILVGTLGVAGYLHMIHQMKELITGAGKVYTLANMVFQIRLRM